jgi:hypothetical protein
VQDYFRAGSDHQSHHHLKKNAMYEGTKTSLQAQPVQTDKMVNLKILQYRSFLKLEMRFGAASVYYLRWDKP